MAWRSTAGGVCCIAAKWQHFALYLAVCLLFLRRHQRLFPQASLCVLGAACNLNTLQKTAGVIFVDRAGAGVLRWMRGAPVFRVSTSAFESLCSPSLQAATSGVAARRTPLAATCEKEEDRLGKLKSRMNSALMFDRLEHDYDVTISRLFWPNEVREWLWIVYGQATCPPCRSAWKKGAASSS